MQLYLKRWSEDEERTHRSGFFSQETTVVPVFHLRTRLEVTLEEYEIFKTSGLHARTAAIYNGDEVTYLFELVNDPFIDYRHVNLKRIMAIESNLLATVVELRDFIAHVSGDCEFEVVRE